MKIALTIAVTLFMFTFSFAQAPGVIWTKLYIPNRLPYDENVTEGFFDAKKMQDGGFILAGFDTAFTFTKEDLLKKYTTGRPKLIRTDKNGSIQWQTYDYHVSNSGSSFTSVQPVSDGIVATGYGSTSYGGLVKYYIAKFDDNGNELWYKLYGGVTGTSRAYSIQETNDGGYIVAGITTANDGDVSGNHHAGTSDVWMLKLDGSGNIQWKKCYGGSNDDSAYAVIQTPDNGFIVVGSSTSIDGDLTGNNGASDGWILKIDGSGNLVWQKNIGGSNDEDFKGVVYNSDTSFTLTGFTSSTTITDNGNHGMRDLWLIKIKDVSGNILWSKNFGGSSDEQGFSIERTVGNGYLVGGYTESTNGDVTNNNGLADAWVLNINSDGSLIWQKCVGSNKDDFGMAALYLSPSDFAIAGSLQSITGPYSLLDAFLSRLGNANTIKAFLFNDANLNGAKDLGESGFNEALVTTTQSSFQRSAVPQNGIVNIDVGLGTYNTSVHINSPYFNITPASINSTFATYFNRDSITFAIQPIPNNRDLVISVIPSWAPRPGHFQFITIFYKNIGTDIVSSGEILFKHDNRLVFGNASPAITSSNGDTLKWTFSNLKPFDSASIRLAVDIPLSVHLGDTLTSMAIITPVANDVTPFDDTAILKQRVVGSYDPNDKTENNGGIIGSDYITQGKYLNYTIRFQNTGTDTAFNVIVRDTLDSKLDWSTFEMVAASHPYTVSITNQNKIEWTFANINLPDSNINEPLSHGYLSYRVKPKSTAVVGDMINNLASIYFDFNLPIATNNAITLVWDNFTPLPVKLLSFTGQLTNNMAQLHWQTANETNFERFEVERSIDGASFNKIASVAFANSLHDYKATDYVQGLQSKHIFYRLKLVDADGKFSYSKVIAFNIDAVSRFMVYPNPANTEIFVSITADKKTTLYIKIVDATGRMVSYEQKTIEKGNNVFPVNISKLQKGNYIVQIVDGSETKANKVVIMK